MKSKILFFLLLINAIYTLVIEEKRAAFVTNLYNYAKKEVKLPSGYSKYVLNIDTSSSIIFQGVSLSNIPKVKRKYGLSDVIVTQIKAA